MREMTKIYKIDDQQYEVKVNSVVGNRAEVNVNGVIYNVEIFNNSTVEEHRKVETPVAENKTVANSVNVTGEGKPITAPLPGVIVSLAVKEGDSVKAGQTVAVLEAMKMENDIQSEYDGVVSAVKVNPGDSILEGAVIVTIN